MTHTAETAHGMPMDINRCYFGDCRALMRSMNEAGIEAQMCVTSPPYWGMRDYGVEGQIGLEETLAEYIDRVVAVCTLIGGLLNRDGTLWLNLGDTYAYSRRGGNRDHFRNNHSMNLLNFRRDRYPAGIKKKDLLGIPWRVAFALQDMGWILRSEIIWHRTNPMPESVKDRPASCHEHLFLLAKSERYYYDEAVLRQLKQYRRDVWSSAVSNYRGAHFATFPKALVEPCILAGSRSGDVVLDPFLGSGTTAEVAARLGRQWLGCEINPAYETLQACRTMQTGLAL